MKLEGLLRNCVTDIVEGRSLDTLAQATLSFPEEKQIRFWIDRERNTSLYCRFYAIAKPFKELLSIDIYRHEDLHHTLGSMDNYLAESDLKKFLTTFVKGKLKGKPYQEVCGMLASMQELYSAPGVTEEAVQLAKFVRQMIGKA